MSHPLQNTWVVWELKQPDGVSLYLFDMQMESIIFFRFACFIISTCITWMLLHFFVE